MPLPVNDPNECINSVIADASLWISTGSVPNLEEAAGHGATVLGALLHNHGVGAAGLDEGKLRELANAVGAEQPQGMGGPFINMLVQTILLKFGPIIAQMILKLIEQRTS